MDELFWMLAGFMVATFGLAMFLRCKRYLQERREYRADEVLQKHGMRAELYLPNVGEDDPELREALFAYALSGKIILNAEGEIVGKLCPKETLEPLDMVLGSNKQVCLRPFA